MSRVFVSVVVFAAALVVAYVVTYSAHISAAAAAAAALLAYLLGRDTDTEPTLGDSGRHEVDILYEQWLQDLLINQRLEERRLERREE